MKRFSLQGSLMNPAVLQMMTEDSRRDPNLRHISLIKRIVMQYCHFWSLALLSTFFLLTEWAKGCQRVTACRRHHSDLFPPPPGSWPGSIPLYPSWRGKLGMFSKLNTGSAVSGTQEEAGFQPCMSQALHKLRSCAHTSEKLKLLIW